MKAVAGAIALNTTIALVLTALFYAQGYGHGGWGVFGRWFAMNLIISHSIGSLCQVILGRVIPLFWHRTRLRWPLLISVLLLLGFAGCVAAVAVIPYVFSPTRPVPFWRTVFEIFEPAAIVTVIVGAGGATVGAYRHRIEEANALLRVKDLETSSARLASIESRIQPHFLFNALNSISSLIREDPARAERLVEQLASLLRSSLDTQEAHLIPLAREMKLVEDYLEIQRARFGDRLRYRLDVPASLAGAGVPPFSIQTLVENSVKFAVEPRLEGGEVRVLAQLQGGRLEVAVSDDGPGFQPLSPPNFPGDMASTTCGLA